MQSLGDLQRRYHTLLGEYEHSKKVRSRLNDELDRLNASVSAIDKASLVISELANSARLEFSEEVDSLVTLAIRSVFTEEFRFALTMTSAGGRLQCTPVVIENIDGEESEYTPKDDMGGSVLDIIGIALRVVLHRFSRDKRAPLFFMDEPLKYTGHDELIVRAGEMISELSSRLGLQFVVITHEQELAEIAEVSYRVVRRGGVSTVAPR